MDQFSWRGKLATVQFFVQKECWDQRHNKAFG